MRLEENPVSISLTHMLAFLPDSMLLENISSLTEKGEKPI